MLSKLFSSLARTDKIRSINQRLKNISDIIQLQMDDSLRIKNWSLLVNIRICVRLNDWGVAPIILFREAALKSH